MADQKEFKRRLKVLMNRTENLACVDCNERQPRWASLIKPPPGSTDRMGMGALMCLECSGSHRRLGVHISFVRSVNLDSWKEHEVQIMENGGNAKVNALFEAHLLRSGAKKPDNHANGQQREQYIRDKYERRKYFDPSGLDNFIPAEEVEEEETVKPTRRSVSAPHAHSSAASRAPSEAARRRAEARQARLATGGTAVPADRPVRIGAVAAAPVSAPAPLVDLLDFASMSSTPSAPAVPAPAAPPPQANETMDLFADMNFAASSAPSAASATKSNDDIMSLFAPSNVGTMGAGAGAGAVVSQSMGHGQMMMSNPPAAHSHNMMMGTQPTSHGQMMMGNQPATHGHQSMMSNQTGHNQMMMSNQAGYNQMMMSNQTGHSQMMMGNSTAQSQMTMGNVQSHGQMNAQMTQQPMMMMPQQGQYQTNMQGIPQQHMAMNSGGVQQQMNSMMIQQNNVQGMMMMPNMGGMQGQHVQQQHNNYPMMMMASQALPMMPLQQQVSEGDFGMAAPMGSGPSISALQGTPQKEDPFAQFGFNAFR